MPVVSGNQIPFASDATDFSDIPDFSAVPDGGAPHTDSDLEVATVEVDLDTAFANPDDALIDIHDDGMQEISLPSEKEITGLEGWSVANNPFFRALGISPVEGSYFMCHRTSRVIHVTDRKMRPATWMQIAPLGFWQKYFPGKGKKEGQVDWDSVIDAMTSESMRKYVWEPNRLLLQGMRMDHGEVVFNTGARLLLPARQAIAKIAEYNGEYTYAISAGKDQTPDIYTPYEATSDEVRQTKSLIEALDWKEDTRDLSVVALFGMLAIAPLCGILDWKSHIWIDGPFSSGKSWIVQNIINPILGNYKVRVQSNTTEAALRALIANKATVVLFDEAEGERKQDRERIEAMITLARACSTGDGAEIVQGVPGGGGVRTYTTDAMFVMTSIVPQLAASADHSRFARLHLGSGRDYESFREKIAEPAKALFTKEFSDRWIGRMILRAKDYEAVRNIMVHALSQVGTGPRSADVYGCFAAGCWLMLRDGVPEDVAEAKAFIEAEFKTGAIDTIRAENEEVMSNRNHVEVIDHIRGATVRTNLGNGAPSAEVSVGALISAAIGEDEDKIFVNHDMALVALIRYGIRIGDVNGKPTDDTSKMATVVFHSNSVKLKGLLENSPYKNGYAAVLLQQPRAKRGGTTRFGSSHSSCRPIYLPLSDIGFTVRET